MVYALHWNEDKYSFLHCHHKYIWSWSKGRRPVTAISVFRVTKINPGMIDKLMTISVWSNSLVVQVC